MRSTGVVAVGMRLAEEVATPRSVVAIAAAAGMAIAAVMAATVEVITAGEAATAGGAAITGVGVGVGLGLGLYFASLPLYYSTYYWNGVPYYYADGNYYLWDGAVSQYQTVSPPAGLQGQGGAPAPGPGTSELIAYPKNGQSQDQQGKDKFECHQWASSQTGFDPTQPAAATATANRGDYMRAQAACLEGRGYSVE